jgi:hypothetical protein
VGGWDAADGGQAADAAPATGSWADNTTAEAGVGGWGEDTGVSGW